jgi:biopolymer transport protein ExbD
MGKKSKALPEINASSMADIAFLLLIFFLVTTEIAIDEGITVTLPPYSDEPPPPVESNDRNTLTVNVNSRDQLLVEEELMDVKELRSATMKFIDNNGLDPAMSDSPQEAIVSFKGDRGTSYEMYIEVYNELRGAYNDLRDNVSKRKFGKIYEDLIDTAQINEVKQLYPIRISEAEPTDFGASGS